MIAVTPLALDRCPRVRSRIGQNGSRRNRWRSFAATLAALLVLASIARAPTVTAEGERGDSHWVGTWRASPQPAEAPLQLDGQTLRMVVHTSLGGRHVRVHVSNAYGTSSLLIGAAHVALSAGPGAIAAGTDRVLTFGGLPTISIPPGALVVSDAAALDVPALGDLAVSLYLPERVQAMTEHSAGLQTTYASDAGDFTDAATLSGSTTQSFYFLSGVDVGAAGNARAIVALGDSVTDGIQTTLDTRPWPTRSI